MIGKKEELPPVKVGNHFHTGPVHILKDAFQMHNVFKVGYRPTIFHGEVSFIRRKLSITPICCVGLRCSWYIIKNDEVRY